MGDTEKRVCRYFNTLGGCWYGDNCKFLHIFDERPPCKFYVQKSQLGCRFGSSCHFYHERAPLKAVENIYENINRSTKNITKENEKQLCLSGTNNNMAHSHVEEFIPEVIDEKHSPEINDALKSEIYSELSINESESFTDTQKLIPGVDKKDMTNSLLDEINIDETTNPNQQILSLDLQIFCGSCKRALNRQGNDSYCNILKDHYLECFLDKEGDHVKCVKMKAALELGQMYWCKTCILIFEKPWSLFQHMVDKAKGVKVQRWERKIHLDWIENVAGLMAGHDLGLFNPIKLRTDLRNLLADQHTVEEEFEAAAVAAATMVQWLTPISNPWRLHQREIMRKIENLHKHIMRKAGGAAALARAAFSVGTASTYSGHSYGQSIRNTFPHSQIVPSPVCDPNSQENVKAADEEFSQLSLNEHEATGENAETIVQWSGDNEPHKYEFENIEQLSDDIAITQSDRHNAGASGDHILEEDEPSMISICKDEKANCAPKIKGNVNSCDNNTNSASFSRSEYKPGYIRNPSYFAGQRSKGSYNRWFSDERPMRGFRGGFSFRQRYSVPPNRIFYGHRAPRFGPPYHSFRSVSAASLPVSYDLNCGFTNDEVEELLSQGIKPWDSEATAALAVLHGEMDHLLE